MQLLCGIVIIFLLISSGASDSIETATYSSEPTGTSTYSSEPTGTSTSTPTETSTSTPTETSTSTPTGAPTATPTGASTATPTETSTSTPTGTSTSTPTGTSTTASEVTPSSSNATTVSENTFSSSRTSPISPETSSSFSAATFASQSSLTASITSSLNDGTSSPLPSGASGISSVTTLRSTPFRGSSATAFLTGTSFESTNNPENFTAATSTTTTTTTPAISVVFECDFTSKCFDDLGGIATIVNESNYTAIGNWNSSAVLPFPLSGADAIYSRDGNVTCQMPYPLMEVDRAAPNQSVSFCYNNQCYGTNNLTINCIPDSYVLIKLNATNTNRNISFNVLNATQNESTAYNQQLQLKYYMGVDGGIADSSQQILIYIDSNVQTRSSGPIGTISAANNTANAWQNYTLDFIAPSIYKLIFPFKVGNSSGINYFALDKIVITRSREAFINESTTSPPNTNPDLGLILGLSLGLGIPFVLAVIAGIIFCLKKHKSDTTLLTRGTRSNDLMKSPNYGYYDEEVPTTHF